MRRIVRWTLMASFALAMLPAAGSADENEKKGVYECGDWDCSEWKEKGENTCRSCTMAICRKEGEKELLVPGGKTKKQCYPGHGEPPSEEELNQ